MLLVVRPTRTANVTLWDMTRDFAQRLQTLRGDQPWAFRGHSRTCWGLESTLERAARQFGYPFERLQRIEEWMLKQFQRRAHHYITDKPETLVEWLALIQHYGGPTRLLDFSRSFYVAAFLAIETAHDDAAVWAVNLAFLDDALDQAKKRFPDIAKKSEIEIAESCLEGTLVPKLVLKVEPNRLNERLSIQQGLFLLPTDLSLSFKENFCATFDEGDMFQSPKETEYGGEFTEELNHDLSGTKVIKIIIPRGIHRRAVMDLQYMNVASTTLFPGLDGFARSLRHYLRAYDKYDDPDKP